jgi:hypothetical protein
MVQKNLKKTKRLPINFHQTFIPERRYITALLQYAAGDEQGTDQEISAATGIPTGKSSGKVPAIINYSSAMGLIHVQKGQKAGQKHILLTDFGLVVYMDDPSISEPLTQWLTHLHLCRKNGGADVWYHTFGAGRDVLGMKFTESELNDYLNSVFGKRTKSHIGPMIRTYEEQAALKNAEVIKRTDSSIIRMPAPLLRGFTDGYCAFILSLWKEHFTNDGQVTLKDFEAVTYWKSICGWSDRHVEMVLAMAQEAGAIDVDRQMRPWVLRRKCDVKPFWQKLYAQLA